MRMNRERLAWTLCIVAIACLALALPGSFAARDDEYAFVRTLIDVHRQVAANYVEPVDEQKLNDAAVSGMLSTLDPYTIYVPPAQETAFNRVMGLNYEGVGIQLDQTDDGKAEVISPIEGSPAFKAGVQAGDIIEKVDGTSVESLKLDDVTKKVAGPVNTPVTLFVRHVDGKEESLTMTRQQVIVPTVKGYRRNADNSWDYFVCDDPKIAYLRITQFTPETGESVKRVMEGLIQQNLQGLILDLRFNPGGLLEQARDVVNLFVDKGLIVTTKGRNRPEDAYYAKPDNALPKKFPMVVLVNEHSASAAEIVSGALKDLHRAVIVGTRTYGKGSVQEVIPLEEHEGELKLTVAYYYLPSGRLVHKKPGSTDWGVDPQIVVPMTPEAEQAVSKSQFMDDILRRPVAKASTRPGTNPATQPATFPPSTQDAANADVQLQTAVSTMVALVVFQNEQQAGGVPTPGEPTPEANVVTPLTPVPASEPATQPTTAPAR